MYNNISETGNNSSLLIPSLYPYFWIIAVRTNKNYNCHFFTNYNLFRSVIIIIIPTLNQYRYLHTNRHIFHIQKHVVTYVCTWWFLCIIHQTLLYLEESMHIYKSPEVHQPDQQHLGVKVEDCTTLYKALELRAIKDTIVMRIADLSKLVCVCVCVCVCVSVCLFCVCMRLCTWAWMFFSVYKSVHLFCTCFVSLTFEWQWYSGEV